MTIFYSWQSDDGVTKKFIDKALPEAIRRLKNDSSLDVAPRFDKDTKGVVGSVNIMETIREKIDKCSIFVADISLVDKSSITNEKLVNQNVMFELGYAVAKHTFKNVVLLFNKDKGSPKNLPFDILGHKIHQFSIKNDNDGKQIQKDLADILTAHLNNLPKTKPDNRIELDEVETLIMRVFTSIQNEKRISIVGRMGGDMPMVFGVHDDNLWKELEEKSSGDAEIIANLEELESKGILTTTLTSKGKPIYKPTKEGFRMITELT